MTSTQSLKNLHLNPSLIKYETILHILGRPPNLNSLKDKVKERMLSKYDFNIQIYTTNQITQILSYNSYPNRKFKEYLVEIDSSDFLHKFYPKKIAKLKLLSIVNILPNYYKEYPIYTSLKDIYPIMQKNLKHKQKIIDENYELMLEEINQQFYNMQSYNYDKIFDKEMFNKSKSYEYGDEFINYNPLFNGGKNICSSYRKKNKLDDSLVSVENLVKYINNIEEGYVQMENGILLTPRLKTRSPKANTIFSILKSISYLNLNEVVDEGKYDKRGSTFLNNGLSLITRSENKGGSYNTIENSSEKEKEKLKKKKFINIGGGLKNEKKNNRDSIKGKLILNKINEIEIEKQQQKNFLKLKKWKIRDKFNINVNNIVDINNNYNNFNYTINDNTNSNKKIDFTNLIIKEDINENKKEIKQTRKSKLKKYKSGIINFSGSPSEVIFKKLSKTNKDDKHNKLVKFNSFELKQFNMINYTNSLNSSSKNNYKNKVSNLYCYCSPIKKKTVLTKRLNNKDEKIMKESQSNTNSNNILFNLQKENFFEESSSEEEEELEENKEKKYNSKDIKDLNLKANGSNMDSIKQIINGSNKELKNYILKYNYNISNNKKFPDCLTFLINHQKRKIKLENDNKLKMDIFNNCEVTKKICEYNKKNNLKLFKNNKPILTNQTLVKATIGCSDRDYNQNKIIKHIVITKTKETADIKKSIQINSLNSSPSKNINKNNHNNATPNKNKGDHQRLITLPLVNVANKNLIKREMCSTKINQSNSLSVTQPKKNQCINQNKRVSICSTNQSSSSYFKKIPSSVNNSNSKSNASRNFNSNMNSLLLNSGKKKNLVLTGFSGEQNKLLFNEFNTTRNKFNKGIDYNLYNMEINNSCNSNRSVVSIINCNMNKSNENIKKSILDSDGKSKGEGYCKLMTKKSNNLFQAFCKDKIQNSAFRYADSKLLFRSVHISLFKDCNRRCKSRGKKETYKKLN